jgi:membrane-associated protease RseP (regulator of RpoE activity)
MRSILGWQLVLTRSVSLGAILACASATWAQTSDSNRESSEPSTTGSVTQPAGQAPAVAQQRGSTDSNATIQNEASGTGPVLGAHFDHGARGSRQELKIISVDSNSPASQAGLQQNDRLVSVDGRSFANPRQLIAYLSVLGGRPVPITVERNGREMNVQLFPGQFQGDRAWLGVLLEEDQSTNGQNPNQKDSNNTKTAKPQGDNGANTKSTAEKGAEISQVYPNGPAARAGLRPGDVIVQINGQKIDGAAELVALVHEMKPQTQANFEVMRDNKQTKVPVTLGSRNQEYSAQFGPGQFGPGQGQFGQGAQGQYGPSGPSPGAGQWTGPGQFGPGGQFAGQFPQGPWQGQGNMNATEFHQQLTQQNQRIEDELKQLREEIKQLRDQLQKK